MPCDTYRNPQQTAQERQAEIDAALAELERQINSGRVNLVIGPDGGVCFAGWSDADRRGITDVCAFRTLTERASWPLQQAVSTAEMQSGRKVNEQAVAAGVHSHDGGKTWGKH